MHTDLGGGGMGWDGDGDVYLGGPGMRVGKTHAITPIIRAGGQAGRQTVYIYILYLYLDSDSNSDLYWYLDLYLRLAILIAYIYGYMCTVHAPSPRSPPRESAKIRRSRQYLHPDLDIQPASSYLSLSLSLHPSSRRNVADPSPSASPPCRFIFSLPNTPPVRATHSMRN